MEASNLTTNSSGIVHHSRRSTKTLDYAIPYTAASGTFSLVGGASNLFVMFILLKYVGFKQNTFVYMFSLFLSDFLYNCVIQPQVCYYQFPSSVVTVFGGKYIHAASLACILTGSSSIFFASCDQYIFIKHPFFYGNHITKYKTLVVVFCIWLVCLGIGVIRFYNIVLVKEGYLLLIAASFVLTILVQMMIFVTAREHDQRIQQLHRSLEHNHPRGIEEESAVRARESHTSNKAAKTIGFLLAVYIATWLPVNIYRQEYRWNGGDPKVYHKWVKIINLLIQLHSCINPWVFVLRSQDMKVGIAKFVNGLGVHECFAGERSFDIVSSNATLSSRALGSKENVFESRAPGSKENIFDSRDNPKNGQEQEILGQGSAEIRTSGKNEKIERHTSHPCGSANIRDNESSSSGNIQGAHINSSYENDVTLENDESKRDEGNSVSDDSLNKVPDVNVQEGMVNGVSGNIEDEENCDHGERNNGNDVSMPGTGNDVSMPDTRNDDSRDDGI